MSSGPPVVRALRQFLEFLAARRTDYALLGGMAVRALSIPRPTYDIDLLIAVPAEDVARVAEAAEEAGFVVGAEFRRGFVESLAGLGKFHVSCAVGTRYVRIDLFVLASEYQREALRRRRRHDTDLGELWVISPEDLLLHKLLADRPRDRSDVADLLLVVGSLDLGYLREWAQRLGVADALERALQAAGRA